MIALELVSNDIVPLKTSVSGLDALNWMDEYRLSHLPIVNDRDFLGLISEDDIYDLDDPEAPIGDHALSLTRPFVYEYQHIYEAIKLVSSQKLSLVPVLDEKNHYQGSILLRDLTAWFSRLMALENPGSIVVLEVNHNDFYMSQIAQIVESNDARILSMYIYSHEDSMKLDVTLKLNKNDISPLLQTFYRYNYTVKASFGESDSGTDLMDRYNSLMRFLNT